MHVNPDSPDSLRRCVFYGTHHHESSKTPAEGGVSFFYLVHVRISALEHPSHYVIVVIGTRNSHQVAFLVFDGINSRPVSSLSSALYRIVVPNGKALMLRHWYLNTGNVFPSSHSRSQRTGPGVRKGTACRRCQ